MTTIEKLERLLRERNAYLQHSTETGDYGISFEGYHRRYRSGESLEDVINKAYYFAFWVRKVEVGEIVLAARMGTANYRMFRRIPADPDGYEYTDGVLRAKPSSLQDITIIGKAYDSPIPVESAE